jgi:hypothetical protein
MQEGWRIELAGVTLGEEERAAVDEVLRSGWLSMGPRTEELHPSSEPATRSLSPTGLRRFTWLLLPWVWGREMK